MNVQGYLQPTYIYAAGGRDYPNWNDRRYRCCCSCMHLKTGAFIIGLADIFSISAAFGRGVYLYLTIKDNPMATSWFVVSTLMAVLGAFATLTMFYGVWKEKYLYTLPKLVVNVFTIILLSVSTIGLVYLVFENSNFLIDLLAEHVTSSDYEYARFAVKVGGTVLVVVCLCLAVLESWFFIILYRSFKYLKQRYLWIKMQQRLARGNNNSSTVPLRGKDSVEPMPSPIPATVVINHQQSEQQQQQQQQRFQNQQQQRYNPLPRYNKAVDPKCFCVAQPLCTRLDTHV